MPEHPEPKPEETDETTEETQENKPLGFVQYPAPKGETQYGTYQNPNKR